MQMETTAAEKPIRSMTDERLDIPRGGERFGGAFDGLNFSQVLDFPV